jgi:Tol biopolymer transport system component
MYLLDPGRNTTTQVTFGAASGNFPKWSPDGSRIAFGSNREGVYNIYAAGNGEERLVLADDRNKFLTDWSPDGRFRSAAKLFVYRRFNSNTSKWNRSGGNRP